MRYETSRVHVPTFSPESATSDATVRQAFGVQISGHTYFWFLKLLAWTQCEAITKTRAGNQRKKKTQGTTKAKKYYRKSYIPKHTATHYSRILPVVKITFARGL